jgi:hypothetical protein
MSNLEAMLNEVRHQSNILLGINLLMPCLQLLISPGKIKMEMSRPEASYEKLIKEKVRKRAALGK